VSIPAEVLDEVIGRYVIDRPWKGSSPSYPQRELVLKFGDDGLDAIDIGIPGVSVEYRRRLVMAVFRAFANEVLQQAGTSIKEGA